MFKGPLGSIREKEQKIRFHSNIGVDLAQRNLPHYWKGLSISTSDSSGRFPPNAGGMVCTSLWAVPGFTPFQVLPVSYLFSAGLQVFLSAATHLWLPQTCWV